MTVKTLKINQEELENLLQYADNNEIYFNYIEGNLLDNYTLYDTEELEFDGNSSKYLIVKEKYVNEWSSEQVLIMTDSLETIEQFEQAHEQ